MSDLINGVWVALDKYEITHGDIEPIAKAIRLLRGVAAVIAIHDGMIAQIVCRDCFDNYGTAVRLSDDSDEHGRDEYRCSRCNRHFTKSGD